MAEYSTHAESTASYPGMGGIVGLSYTVLGLNGESGEVADHLKKAMRDDGGELSTDRRLKLLAELGDVLWYVSMACKELGSSLDAVAEFNVAKLASRKERGVISGSGDNR